MTGKELLRYVVSRKVGGEVLRTKGSHNFVRVGVCTTVIPVHSHDLPKGTLRAIERDLEPCLGESWIRKVRG